MTKVNRIHAARQLESDYRAGNLTVFVPSLLRLELLNAAGRSWRLPEADLVEFGGTLDSLRFQVVDVALLHVAYWTAQGLTAYGASYVALAEERGIPLITEDRAILAAAPGIAISLAEI